MAMRIIAAQRLKIALRPMDMLRGFRFGCFGCGHECEQSELKFKYENNRVPGHGPKMTTLCSRSAVFNASFPPLRDGYRLSKRDHYLMVELRFSILCLLPWGVLA